MTTPLKPELPWLAAQNKKSKDAAMATSFHEDLEMEVYGAMDDCNKKLPVHAFIAGRSLLRDSFKSFRDAAVESARQQGRAEGLEMAARYIDPRLIMPTAIALLELAAKEKV